MCKKLSLISFAKRLHLCQSQQMWLTPLRNLVKFVNLLLMKMKRRIRTLKRKTLNLLVEVVADQIEVLVEEAKVMVAHDLHVSSVTNTDMMPSVAGGGLIRILFNFQQIKEATLHSDHLICFSNHWVQTLLHHVLLMVLPHLISMLPELLKINYGILPPVPLTISHASAFVTNYTSPFELVYTDLWGPASFLSSNGYAYYVTFVDAHTRFTWLYFLKHKSEALNAFKLFYQLVITQFATTVKVVQSDWGRRVQALYQIFSWTWHHTQVNAPRTSHQNGTVERKHRQIVEMGLTLLAHASIPLEYWDHSFTTAVYLINRLPTVALTTFTSPYHDVYKVVPDFSMLRVFGCACFPCLWPYNQHKLQHRSTECVYLGPSPQHKGHKFLSAEGRIYISKDVLFNEMKFPFPSLFGSKPPELSQVTEFPPTIPLTSQTSLTKPPSPEPQATLPSHTPPSP